MAPHAPPCSADEVRIGDVCYPKPNTLEVLPLGGSFQVIVGDAVPELLPVLVKMTGNSSHMLVSKSGSGVNITITSVQPDEVDALKGQLTSNYTKDDLSGIDGAP
jgi:hypothetical protein